MNQHDELRQQLWELAYGLLTPDEVAALHARIKADPVVARLYAEVRLEADLVADAAKVADPSIQFHPQGPARVLKPAGAARLASGAASAKGASLPPKSNRGVNWLAGMAGLALAALLCFVLFRPAPSGGQLAEAFIATTVEAPAQLQAGVSQRIAITTTDANETPRAAEVEVQLLDTDGTERLRETVSTDESGRASLVLPGTAIGEHVEWKFTAKPADVHHTKSSESVPPVVFEAQAVPEPVEAYVLLDKPTYEPGDTVHYAFREVTRFSKQLATATPVDGEPVVASEMAAMAAPHASSSEPIVGQFQLAEGTDPTQLDFAVREGLQRQLQLHGNVASHFFQHMAVGSQPATPAPSALALETRSAGEQADAPGDDAVPLMRGDMRAKSGDVPRAQAAAESDLLAKRPAQEDESTSDNAPLNEPAAGIKAALSGVAGSPRDEFAQSGATMVEAGRPIEVRLPDVPHVDRYLLTAHCAGRVVAVEQFVRSQDKAKSDDEAATKASESTAADVDADSDVALTPPPEVDGEILVSVYADDQQPPHLLSEQRFFRQPAHRLELHVDGLQATYAPGERVQLAVTVVDENSEPVDATLSVRVWNEAIIAASPAPPIDIALQLLGSSRPSVPMLAMDAFGAMRSDALADTPSPDNLYSGFADSGFKLPTPEDAAALAYSQPAQLGDRLSLAGPGESRQISNLAEAKSAYAAALAAAREEAAHRKATLGRLLLVGGLALLVLLAMQILIKASAKTYIWLPSAIVATASLAIGVVWLNPSFQVGETLTTASRPDEASDKQAARPELHDQVTTFERDSVRSETVDDSPAPQKDERQAVESLESKQSESDFPAASKPAADAPAPDLPTAGAMPADAPVAEEASKENLNREVPALGKKLQEQAEPTPPAAPIAPPAPALAKSFSAGAEMAPAGSAEGAPPSAKPSSESPAQRFGNSRGAGSAGQDELAERATPDLRARRKALDEMSRAASGPGLGAAPQPFAARSATPPPAAAAPAPSAASSEFGIPPTDAKSLFKGDATTSGKTARAKDAAEKEDNAGRLPRVKLAPAAAPESDSASDAKKQFDVKGKTTAPASLLFLPALQTDSEGRATITFELPPVDSEYRILIDAIGHGRIGSRQEVIRVQSTADDAK